MDLIQRKLNLIDCRLSRRGRLHEHLITIAPLLFLITGLSGGILLQNLLPIPILPWLILLGIFATTAIILFILQRNKQTIIAYMALLCFVCLGAIRLNSFTNPAPGDIRNFVTSRQQLATIRGIITTNPRINKLNRWQFAKFKPTDPTSRFYLELTEVKTTTGWEKAAGTLYIQTAEPVLDLKPSDRIQAYCVLDKFGPPKNPGQPDIAKYMARKNVFVTASIKTRDSIKILENKPVSRFIKLKNKIKQIAVKNLNADLTAEDSTQGLLQALLLGRRHNIDSATYAAFRKTGLLHFISLSGLHLGIFMGIIWWLCKIAGLMKPVRAAICIITVTIFLIVVPPRAPTFRAAIICYVFCLSFFFRRHPNPINTLSLAAIILLLIRPTQLFQAGWQLSFASVLGILLFTDRINLFLYEKITDRRWTVNLDSRPFLQKITTTLLLLFSVGLAAWITSAPVLLYHFYAITPLASVWTILAFPLVAVILILGFLKIVLALLLPTAAAILALIVTILADLLIGLVKFIANVIPSEILIGRVPVAIVIFCYALIFFIAFAHFKKPVIKTTIRNISILAIILFLGITKWQRTHYNSLTLTCLDVGHGQAILAQLPPNKNILFDAGSLHNADVGNRIIAPFLKYKGIGKIDCIIISHNDIDHINAIPEIITNCNVDAIYANNAFFDKKDEWGTAKFLNDTLRKQGIKIEPLPAELNLDSPATVKTLWPKENYLPNEQLTENDESVVSVIEFAATKILLTSDTGKFAQKELLKLYPDLNPQIVIAPHHGSTKTTDRGFIEKLAPQILLHSCSRKQYKAQKQPSHKNNPRLYYTAKDNTITVNINSKGQIKTTCFSKEKSPQIDAD